MRANSFFFCQGVEVEWSGTPKNWEHFYLNTYLSFNNVIFRTLCLTAKQAGLRTSHNVAHATSEHLRCAKETLWPRGGDKPQPVKARPKAKDGEANSPTKAFLHSCQVGPMQFCLWPWPGLHFVTKAKILSCVCMSYDQQLKMGNLFSLSYGLCKIPE